jgi:hypothetical protein
MRKIFIVAISLIVVLWSCKPPTEPVSELTIIGYKYYKKQPKKLFTGIAITKFENGSISSSTEVKEGIPNGKWFDYGHKGEAIHEGEFFPLLLDDSSIGIRNFERLNISIWKEGAYSFIDAFMVGQKISNQEIDTVKLKQRIELLLRQKNIIGKADTINELKIVNGEL